MIKHVWASVLAFLALSGAAQAHEFWIDPVAYQIAPGERMQAVLRVGEDYEGASYAYVPRNFQRFDTRCAGQSAKVRGRAGDRPALNKVVNKAGLCVVIHQTSHFSITYKTMEKFKNFVSHKDAKWTLAAHQERGLPEADFRERYSRYAKSLIAVGNGAGKDSVTGLLTEIVAQANPYTDTMSGGFPVQVLYQGKPRANVQIELFEKSPNGRVKISLHRTNGQGLAKLPVKAGHSYLVDSVVLRAIEGKAANDPVWESLWASLTFQVPAR